MEATEQSSPSQETSRLIYDRQKLIDAIGPAERNSMTCKLELTGQIGDEEVRLLFPRKRGMEKKVTYTDLAGAAMVTGEEAATELLSSLPQGGEIKQESYKDGGKWVNGYVLEKIQGGEVDARVRGFTTGQAQAEYEVKAQKLIDFGGTLTAELNQELGDEWPVIAGKAKNYFRDEDLPPGWQIPPDQLKTQLNMIDLNSPDRIFPAPANRVSGRVADKPSQTHTVIFAKQVDIPQSTMDKLLNSQHLQVVGHDTDVITAPIIAVSKSYLEEMKANLVDKGDEDIPLGKKFGLSGQAYLGSGIFD